MMCSPVLRSLPGARLSSSEGLQSHAALPCRSNHCAEDAPEDSWLLHRCHPRDCHCAGGSWKAHPDWPFAEILARILETISLARAQGQDEDEPAPDPHNQGLSWGQHCHCLKFPQG
ncbi:hypothetical protein GCM10009716_24570 [Streptomyces sodiiphilus]|uniref:Uncharacterized protein n=1 Tax=Streptomyces sodiiphilus TaxID=226217 RepID=A0ABP5AHD0_9ACTN